MNYHFELPTVFFKNYKTILLSWYLTNNRITQTLVKFTSCPYLLPIVLPSEYCKLKFLKKISFLQEIRLCQICKINKFFWKSQFYFWKKNVRDSVNQKIKKVFALLDLALKIEDLLAVRLLSCQFTNNTYLIRCIMQILNTGFEPEHSSIFKR